MINNAAMNILTFKSILFKTIMGHQGTWIKDPWTKPKGVGVRVGVAGG